MTQNERDLLIKDLCARLPYGVKVQISIWDYNDKMTTEEDATLYSVNMDGYCETVEYDAEISIEEITPYLFPLSSMTEEQEKEYNSLNCWELGCFPHTEDALDYLIANHFDYRGLIPMGLAIDATNLNIY